MQEHPKRYLPLAALAATVVVSVICVPAHAREHVWSATLHSGPFTNRRFTDVFARGEFVPVAAVIGLAVDRRFFRLGWGFHLEGEAQITQHFYGLSGTAFDLGIGIRFDDFPWSDSRPSSFALYAGPSYSTNPPTIVESSGNTGGLGQSFNTLIYVSAEFAVALSETTAWDAVARYYHRSSAYGLFKPPIDEGQAVTLGLRKRF